MVIVVLLELNVAVLVVFGISVVVVSSSVEVSAVICRG